MSKINNKFIMQDRSSKKKRSKDENVLAKSVVDSIIEETEIENEKPKKNPAAVLLGRLGGLKGGRARAQKLTAERRKEIAMNAAKARWEKEKNE